MLKLLKIIILILSSSMLFASNLNEDMENFLRTTLSKYTITSFDIHANKTLEYPKNWKAYFITLRYNIHGKEVVLRDVVFSDGEFISRDITNLKTQTSYKDMFLNNWEKYINE